MQRTYICSRTYALIDVVGNDMVFDSRQLRPPWPVAYSVAASIDIQFSSLYELSTFAGRIQIGYPFTVVRQVFRTLFIPQSPCWPLHLPTNLWLQESFKGYCLLVLIAVNLVRTKCQKCQKELQISLRIKENA